MVGLHIKITCLCLLLEDLGCFLHTLPRPAPVTLSSGTGLNRCPTAAYGGAVAPSATASPPSAPPEEEKKRNRCVQLTLASDGSPLPWLSPHWDWDEGRRKICSMGSYELENKYKKRTKAFVMWGPLRMYRGFFLDMFWLPWSSSFKWVQVYKNQICWCFFCCKSTFLNDTDR